MLRILIAEDEMIERMVLKKTLEKHFGDQCEILDAENGKMAMEVFRRMEIHIVILDIEMPVLNGVQTAELMRKEKVGFCIIFLTAYDKFEYAKRAIAVRAMEYLLKPYSERELVGVVEEAIRVSLSYDKHEVCPDESSLMGENIRVAEQSNPIGEVPPSWMNVLVSMIEEYIRKHYMDEISMRDAAKSINYSETYFCKMFKQQFGQNFTSYLAEYRIEEAKKMLSQSNTSVKEVGARVGYPDSNYFARVFRRMNGISPSEYRMRFFRKL